MTLFSFLTPGLQMSKIIPIAIGIRAVIDGVSDVKYPQAEKLMRIMALIRLAVCAFIFLAVVFDPGISYIICQVK
jgi:hypothetical protein